MIDPSKSFPSMKAEVVKPNLAYGAVTNLAKPSKAAPAPKTGVTGAHAQELKAQHDADGKLLNHVAPAGETKDLASALYPSMVPAYRVAPTPGFDHLTVDPKAQEAFIKLAQSMGLSQAQVQQLADFHVRLTFDPVKK
jgi:hypothetical protein